MKPSENEIQNIIKILFNELEKKGIKVSFDDEMAKPNVLLDNVVFKYNDKTLKIYTALFFREFGISKDIMNNETFYNEYQKMILKYLKK